MSIRISVSTRSSVNDAEVSRWAAQVLGPSVLRAASRVRDNARGNLTAAGRVDIGHLRRGISAEAVGIRGRQVQARVVSPQAYAKYVHDGTTGPIVPRRARVLRFRPRGGSYVFAPSVKGIAGTPYLTDALKQLRPGDFT